MIPRILFCLIILTGVQCGGPVHARNLQSSLRETVEFFQKLKLDYEDSFPNATVVAEINSKIADHVRSENGKSERAKRETPDEGIMLLNGFQDQLTFGIKDIRDLCFYALETASGITWFTGVLDSKGLTLFQINNAALTRIGSHQSSYTRIIAEYCESGVLLILQNETGALVIFRLSRTGHNYVLQPIQEFVGGDVSDLTTWQGMNRLHLGVMTPRNISVYTWFGEHFDLVEILNVGGSKLVPFTSKGFMHLAATGISTTIFRYSLRSNSFEIVQRLRASKTLSSFQVNEGHRLDHFLCLSDDSQSIVYKEVRDRFVPFQKLEFARHSVALVAGKSIVLASLDAKDTLHAYQYDGWRFARLNVEIRGVQRMRLVRRFDEELLLIEGAAPSSPWKLLKMSWARKKSWRSLQDEIKRWCEDARAKAARKPVEIPEFRGTLKILNGRIQTLNAAEINGHTAKESLDILKKLGEVSSNLEAQKQHLAAKQSPKDPVYRTLRARKVNIRCDTTCRAAKISTGRRDDPFQKARTSEDENSVLEFKYLRIRDTPSLPCPLPAFRTKNLIVRGLTNGQDIRALHENLLKKRGAQTVTGEQAVLSMDATRIEGPLEVATKSTKQWMEITELRVRELNLADGGFLLPLNGPATTMPGTIEAKRVRLKKLPIMRGSLEGLDSLMPSTLEMTPLRLTGNYHFQDIVIENLLNASDIASESGESMRSILSYAVPLVTDFPANLEVTAGNMKWKNVSLPGFGNFIAANSRNALWITGRKHIPKNVVLSREIYENLKLPKIDGELCGRSASAPELRTMTLRVDHLIARRINASEVHGQLKRSESLGSGKLGKLRVKNLKADRVNSASLNGTKELLEKLEGAHSYKGSLNLENLSVNVLKGPLNFPRPSRIRSIVAKGNVYVGKLNGVDFKDFLDNVVTVHDSVSLWNASFDAGLSSDRAFVTWLPLKLQNDDAPFAWRTKRILGDLESRSIEIPQSFDYRHQESAIISIQGSARFHLEPSTINVNNNNLAEITRNYWMKNETTTFKGSNWHFENVTVDAPTILREGVSAPNSPSWQALSDRLLSKTKLQEINFPVAFGKLGVPFVSGSATSKLRSEVPEVNDALENALTSTGEQMITGKWQFQALNLAGDAKLAGPVNGLHLDKDVVRHDVKDNVITGRKKVLDLTAWKLGGLDFDKWAATAFTENRRKVPTIKGRRTFRTLSVQNLSVLGTVMGKRIDEALLKSTDQSITSQAIIEGSIESPGLIIDGLINDVNVTEIVDSQLKKNDPSLVISSDIAFLNTLNILGNVTIDRGGKSLIDKGRNLNDLDEGSTKTPVILEMTSAIKEALDHRALYINKFEFVPPNSMQEVPQHPGDPQQHCSDEHCNERAVKVVSSNVTDLILVKLIPREENPRIISVQRKRLSIYEVGSDGKTVHLLKELNIPRIEGATIETQKDAPWIILQLPQQTLVLRFEAWQDLQDYVLPRTEVLRTVRTPSHELFLMLSDGIWRLEGSGEPRKLINVPLRGEVGGFSVGSEFYVRSSHDNNSMLLKAHYSGY